MENAEAAAPLTPEEQERYSRHLLLEHLGGPGQERLLAGAVRIELPAAASRVARQAARYLAASGVGTLFLAGPWAAEARAECLFLAPAVRIHLHLVPAAPVNLASAPPHNPGARDAQVPGQCCVEIALAPPRDGLAAALPGLRDSLSAEVPGLRVELDPALPAGAAEAAALGAEAALEALKLLAGSGTPAPQPLRGLASSWS